MKRARLEKEENGVKMVVRLRTLGEGEYCWYCLLVPKVEFGFEREVARIQVSNDRAG